MRSLAALAAALIPLAAPAATVESVATLATGRAALEALYQNPDGSLWMTSNFDHALWRIDRRGKIEQRITLDFAPQVVVRRPDGGLVVTGHRRIPEGLFAPGGAAMGPPPANRMVGLGTLVALVSSAGKIEREVEGPNDSFFNGIDRLTGDSYIIADTIGGSLWRFDAAKGLLERWLTDVSVEGPQGKPSFGGANGLKVHRGAVYYTSRGSLWRVGIGRHGEVAGSPQRYAAIGGDDFDFGRHSDALYLPRGTSLARVMPDGTIATVAEIGAPAPTARVGSDGRSVYLLTRGIVPPGGGAPESKFMIVHLDAADIAAERPR